MRCFYCSVASSSEEVASFGKNGSILLNWYGCVEVADCPFLNINLDFLSEISKLMIKGRLPSNNKFVHLKILHFSKHLVAFNLLFASINAHLAEVVSSAVLCKSCWHCCINFSIIILFTQLFVEIYEHFLLLSPFLLFSSLAFWLATVRFTKKDYFESAVVIAARTMSVLENNPSDVIRAISDNLGRFVFTYCRSAALISSQ